MSASPRFGLCPHASRVLPYPLARRRTKCDPPAVTTDLPVLPPGLTARALTFADAEQCQQMLAAAEVQDLGDAGVDVDDLVGDWKRPSFDLATDSQGVFDGERLVASLEVYRGTRALGGVHPDYRGRGIGTFLVAWAEEHARAKGASSLGLGVPENTTAPDLLRRRGYQQRWDAWYLALGPDDAVRADRPLPEGMTIRPMAAGEEQATFQVIEDAFGEWEARDPSSFEDWAATTLQRPRFEPWHLLVAVDSGPAGDEIVGACFLDVTAGTVYVHQLAVRRDQRGRGIGRLLLVEAFTRGRAKGAPAGELATDSRTGALGLYQSVGMHISATFQHFVLDLA